MRWALSLRHLYMPVVSMLLIFIQEVSCLLVRFIKQVMFTEPHKAAVNADTDLPAMTPCS